MNYRSIFILTLCLLIISCGQDKELSEEIIDPVEEISLDSLCPGPHPIIPEDFTIDLNEDGIFDFEFRYLLGDIESATASSFYGGHIESTGDNQILNHRNQPTLFNLTLNDIKSTVEDPLIWKNFHFSTIVSINYCSNEKWAIKWDIWTLEERPTHLIGLRILDNSLDEMGWIEIEVDDSTGIVTILDKGML